MIAGVVFEGDALPDSGPALKGLASGLLGQPFFARRGLELGNRVTEAFAAAGLPGRRGHGARGAGRGAGRRRAPRLGRERAAGADQPGRRRRKRADARGVHPLAHPDRRGGLVRRGEDAGQLPGTVPHGPLLARQPHPRGGRRRARPAGDGRGGARPGSVRGDRLGLLRAAARQRRLPRPQRLRQRAHRRGGGGRLDEEPLREGRRPRPRLPRLRVTR